MICGPCIVVPAYNEEKRLLKYKDIWIESNKKYFIILVDDGSVDNTSKIAKDLNFYMVIRRESNIGKGYSVREGVLEALRQGAESILYVDADLSVMPDEWEIVLNELKDSDIVVGSRNLKESEVERSLYRDAISKILSRLQNSILNLGIKDTQCGCKAFRREAAEKIFYAPLKHNRFEFDIEVLIRARKNGLKIKEVGIKWHEEKGSKVHIIRDGIEIAKLLIEAQREKSILKST
ncbi:MAG: glycosyltransferase [Thermovenabulum sp.]|uniref:glycosyltransferase n=1 Tax=Thermovenabulum sp. TaxID=3100335 RepID=UPI003C7A1E45